MNMSDENIKSLVCGMHEYDMSTLPANEELKRSYSLSDTFYKRMKNLIKRQNMKNNMKAFRRYAVPFAAILFILFLVSQPNYVSKAYTSAVKWFKEYTKFNYDVDTNINTIPEYELTCVPDSFELINSNYVVNMGYITYKSDSKRIYIIYAIKDASMYVNNKDIEYYEIIDGEGNMMHYFLAVDDTRDSMLIWTTDTMIFNICINGPATLEELTSIKENLHIK